MPRVILHLDLDAFFCSVEEIYSPQLRRKPFAVGGKPDERGVVASCSYAARAFGIHSAMPMARAVRLCRELIIVPVRHGVYRQHSAQAMEKLRALTPLMEQISIDEAFLDLSDVAAEAPRLALDLQRSIRSELNLPSSVGIASNKLTAKIATEIGKKSSKKKNEPPFGFVVVPSGEEAAFLAPLPADMLWGVGPKTNARLAELGIHTIGDIAQWNQQDLIRLFGENGRDLWEHANGIDRRPVQVESETKSISQEITFTADVADQKELEKTLREQAREVARQLRQSDLAAKTVKVKIRWTNFVTITRQITLPTSTDSEDEIFRAAVKLMNSVRKPNQAVRLLGVGASGLGKPIRQLGLWDAGSERSRNLQKALDKLHEKYGEDVVRKG
ncbi:MAG: DNA polymerase IV [Anaerolineales bacterium]|nr:DNA polymerase IV [Anaerolineales bacterium]